MGRPLGGVTPLPVARAQSPGIAVAFAPVGVAPTPAVGWRPDRTSRNELLTQTIDLAAASASAAIPASVATQLWRPGPDLAVARASHVFGQPSSLKALVRSSYITGFRFSQEIRVDSQPFPFFA